MTPGQGNPRDEIDTASIVCLVSKQDNGLLFYHKHAEDNMARILAVWVQKLISNYW